MLFVPRGLLVRERTTGNHRRSDPHPTCFNVNCGCPEQLPGVLASQLRSSRFQFKAAQETKRMSGMQQLECPICPNSSQLLNYAAQHCKQCLRYMYQNCDLKKVLPGPGSTPVESNECVVSLGRPCRNPWKAPNLLGGSWRGHY